MMERRIGCDLRVSSVCLRQTAFGTPWRAAQLQKFTINMTHYIKHLSFGRDYPGIVNPLDGTDVTAHQVSESLETFSSDSDTDSI